MCHWHVNIFGSCSFQNTVDSSYKKQSEGWNFRLLVASMFCPIPTKFLKMAKHGLKFVPRALEYLWAMYFSSYIPFLLKATVGRVKFLIIGFYYVLSHTNSILKDCQTWTKNCASGCGELCGLNQHVVNQHVALDFL